MKTIYASVLMGLSLLFSGCQPEKPAQQHNNTATFHWFDYQGRDPLFAAPLAAGSYQNPIVAGFFPDPSITRKDQDFYLATSTFHYAPGLAILHSKDLVNWQLIGHALTRASQLDMPGINSSQGIYAPTLRYHQGTFYLIGTLVTGHGHFIVTASKPEGPWSDPVLLPEVGGIDPDLFFDDDGKVYISHNDLPPGPQLYDGHSAIWMWQYDPIAKKVITESKKLLVNGGVDLTKKPVWIEGPHLYKHNGWYYLMCAEGGTEDQHSEVIFRSRSLSEPFVPYSNNPILTQRDLDSSRSNPVFSTGHADLLQLPDQSWWAVFLGTRPYQPGFHNTGRETFLLPVQWQDDWPVILPAGQAVPNRPKAPTSLSTSPVPTAQTGNLHWRDEFNGSTPDVNWSWLRHIATPWLELSQGDLKLQPSADKLTDKGQPAFIGRRQQHNHFDASTSLLVPAQGISAGIVAFQNERFHYYMGLRTQDGALSVFLEQTTGEKSGLVTSQPLPVNTSEVQLKIQGDGAEIRFYYATQAGNWQQLGEVQDAKLLSTQISGGFVGTMLGLHTRHENGAMP